MESKQKIYEKTWFMLIMLVLFAPVGIFLIWKYKKFGKTARIIATIIFGIFFLIIIIPGDKNDATQTNKTQNEESDTPITPTVTPTPEPTATPTPEPTVTPEPTATSIPTLAPDNDNTTDNSSNDTSDDSSNLSLGQRNALSMAYEYLEFTSFSHDGLVEQLEYEGFSNEEATYAAEHCGADWNEQAAKTAQDYLDYSAFSRSSLIEQLEYEGFTATQAEYGANAVGY